jgi:tight adherence protein C
MNDILVLAAVFIAVLLISTVIINWLGSRAELSNRIEDTSGESPETELNLPQKGLAGYSPADNELLANYFDVVRRNKNPNSLRFRLIRAGYFSKSATVSYQFTRLTVSAAVLLLSFFAASYILPDQSSQTILVVSMFVSTFTFFIMNIFLERRGDKREREYRKLFPDFMDMLIVCADAGLSLEASVDRVAKEFLQTHRSFGIHLAIMMLEVRGGRRLREALANFAERVHIEEARTLAVLLRQSEELGSSITKTLRVYSAEMRQLRIIRAEEKANTLPIKMLFPLATFLFPISILIVLVPITLKVLSMISNLAPQ